MVVIAEFNYALPYDRVIEPKVGHTIVVADDYTVLAVFNRDIMMKDISYHPGAMYGFHIKKLK